MTAFINLKTATAIGILTLGLAGCSQPNDEASAAPDTATQTDSASADAQAEHDAHEGHGEHDHDHDHDHEGHDHDAHDHDGHEGHEHHHDHDHADMTTYNCQPEQSIDAHYDEHDGKMSAHLLIDGVEYDLLAANGETTDSAIGGIYDTDIGLTDDAGMRWEVTADKSQATLVSLPNSQDSEEAVLFECNVTKG